MRRLLPIGTAVFIAAIIALLHAHRAEAEPAQSVPDLFEHMPPVRLSVVRVLDADFQPISDADVKTIFASAKRMYAMKFGVDNVTFIDEGTLSIEKFFGTYLQKDGPVYRAKNEKRFRVGEKNDFSKYGKEILAFLKNWPVEELQAFLPESERSKYDSYEKIHAQVIRQMKDKIAEIAAMKAGGKPLLRPEKAEFRSFLNWLTALENQDRYDLVLTNTFILYDDMAHPAPHSIFSKCKVGGVSHKNDKRTTLGGRVIMGSTFGMDTDLAFFKEYKNEKPETDLRNKVTGAYIIAHELGHALFKLPDRYDQGPTCIMNNNKDIDYFEGYAHLMKEPHPCNGDLPWLKARSRYYDGMFHFEKKEYEEAVAAFTDVVKTTPKNIDGHYGRYMAEVAYRMSKSYSERGDLKMAKKMAANAARLYRWEKTYQDWLKSFDDANKPSPGPKP